MAVRVTSDDLQEIIETDSLITNLSPFIAAANELVTELCAAANYTDDRLKMIELWLSAHFYAIRDPRAASEGVGEVSISYQHSVGQNLSQTTYGQQALLLDTAGALARLNAQTKTGKRRQPRISWLGTEQSE